MKPPLIDQLNLDMTHKSSSVRLACRIMLGLQLKHLKLELGYEGTGQSWAFRQDGKSAGRQTWPKYCRSKAGIDVTTATIYYQCGEAVKVRLRCLNKPGMKELLSKMEKQPSKITSAERADIIQKIIILGLTKGETQSQLLREYRGVHSPEPLAGRAAIEDCGNEERHYPAGVKFERARLAMVALREMRRRSAFGRELRKIIEEPITSK